MCRRQQWLQEQGQGRLEEQLSPGDNGDDNDDLRKGPMLRWAQLDEAPPPRLAEPDHRYQRNFYVDKEAVLALFNNTITMAMAKLVWMSLKQCW